MTNLDESLGNRADADDHKARTLSKFQSPRYVLDQLLSECDPSEDITTEDHEWLEAPAVSRELL